MKIGDENVESEGLRQDLSEQKGIESLSIAVSVHFGSHLNQFKLSPRGSEENDWLAGPQPADLLCVQKLVPGDLDKINLRM